MIEGVQHPHAVILHHYSLRLVLFTQSLQELRRKVFLVLHRLYVNLGSEEFRAVVFLLALLAQKKQRALSGVKLRIFHYVLYESRLSALQKSGKQINRYFHFPFLLWEKSHDVYYTTKLSPLHPEIESSQIPQISSIDILPGRR